MSNIYLRLRKSDVLKTSILKILKVCLQVSFWAAPTHADIIEFSNFLFQLKNQRSGSKTVCDFSINFYFERNYAQFYIDVTGGCKWCASTLFCPFLIFFYFQLRPFFNESNVLTSGIFERSDIGTKM